MSARRDPHLPNVNPALVAALGVPMVLFIIVAALMASQSAPNWVPTEKEQAEAPLEWGDDEQINISVSDREDPRGVSTESTDKIDRKLLDGLLGAMGEERVVPDDTATLRHLVAETDTSKNIVQVRYTDEHLYIDDAQQHYGLTQLEHDQDENSCFYRTAEGSLATSLCSRVPLEDDGPVAQAIKDEIVAQSEHLTEWDPNLWPEGGFEYLRIEDLEPETQGGPPAQ